MPLYEKFNNKYYLPLEDLAKIYDYDLRYNSYTKVVIIDTKSKKLVKAKSNGSFSVKYKATNLSKTVDKVIKDDELMVGLELGLLMLKLAILIGKILIVKMLLEKVLIIVMS